jgi:hypothetical protein
VPSSINDYYYLLVFAKVSEEETTMTYDPKRRKNRVPPQLRAWVFGRRKKRTHDPKRVSMATGYGKVGSKPYRRGVRGGVAWSGGKTLRYDPNYKETWGRAKAKARGILGKVENNLTWIGLALGLLIPSEVCRAKHGTNLTQHYVNGTIGETKRLFGADPSVTPLDYLKYKFGLSYFGQSTWGIAFWGSLIAQIVTRLKLVSLVSARANTAIKKLSLGSLIASIFGAAFIQGGTPTAPSNSGANTNSNVNALSYYG